MPNMDCSNPNPSGIDISSGGGKGDGGNSHAVCPRRENL